MPDCSGEPTVATSCAFYPISHARLRVHQAPGIPHALPGRKLTCTPRAHSRRENADTRPLRHRPRRRAIQYCRGADDQSTGRGVLDTRFRGYDDWAGLQKRPFANASAGECHSPCHRPKRAVQNVSFRHRPRRRAIQYCRGADDQSRGRGVLDTRFRGYDDWAGLQQKRPFANASAGECHSPCHRPRRRAIQYCRGADDQSRGRGVLDTRFRGYDGEAYDERELFAHASAAKRSSFCLASGWIASLRSQ